MIITYFHALFEKQIIIKIINIVIFQKYDEKTILK